MLHLSPTPLDCQQLYTPPSQSTIGFSPQNSTNRLFFARAAGTIAFTAIE
jgi:hypothetical protein